MRIEIIGKNVRVTDGMRAKIECKLNKLEKYDFIKKDTVVNVLIRTVKDDQIIEVTVPMANKKVVRAEKRDHDLYAAIDMVEETLARQLRKTKEKCRDKKRVHVEAPYEEEDLTVKTIVKEKVVPLAFLTPEEAAEQMEELDHDFHLFMNTRTNSPSVIYKRKDGDYGLIFTPEK